MKNEIKDSTTNKLGYLLHSISVECSYHEFKDANEHDAVSFLARTKGNWEGKEVNDLDYSIQCTTDDAREFAEYILRLCDAIELSKIK